MPESIAAKDQDWNNMDFIGLLILQQHGGVWFHPSTVFIRDWSALIGKREWMIQHDCEATHTGHVSLVDNGLQQRTVMHFFANSTLLCQLIETATTEGRTTKRMNLGEVYRTVYRNMIQNGIRPWSLLPWCFMNLADGCSSTNTNAFQLFEKPNNGGDAKILVGESGIFALQYDAKQWNAQPGTLANFLDQAHQIKSGW
ncbi:hypothetical protein BCR42DRAFT_317904 [Absidia repens]|uniref:Uncharacterized protein n=1 Tax=Absidia repens TaxID=90262 RepID=A0A1X2J006_9FUNG|nr:hypothetical protein BCR42DRAFT_317904 [Absidia repens]